MVLVTDLFIMSFLPRCSVSPCRPAHGPSGTVSGVAEREQAHGAPPSGQHEQTDQLGSRSRNAFFPSSSQTPVPDPVRGCCLSRDHRSRGLLEEACPQGGAWTE